MGSRIAVCSTNRLKIGGVLFEQADWQPRCGLEQAISKEAYVCEVEDGRLFAIKCAIGKEPHPFLPLFEAARYMDGAWIVGIDEKQNRYFTPLFTNAGGMA